jgi:hypothetical protein
MLSEWPEWRKKVPNSSIVERAQEHDTYPNTNQTIPSQFYPGGYYWKESTNHQAQDALSREIYYDINLNHFLWPIVEPYIKPDQHQLNLYHNHRLPLPAVPEIPRYNYQRHQWRHPGTTYQEWKALQHAEEPDKNGPESDGPQDEDSWIQEVFERQNLDDRWTQRFDDDYVKHAPDDNRGEKERKLDRRAFRVKMIWALMEGNEKYPITNPKVKDNRKIAIETYDQVFHEKISTSEYETAIERTNNKNERYLQTEHKERPGIALPQKEMPIKCVCGNCGDDFDVLPSMIKFGYGTKFCSKKHENDFAKDG